MLLSLTWTAHTLLALSTTVPRTWPVPGWAGEHQIWVPSGWNLHMPPLLGPTKMSPLPSTAIPFAPKDVAG